MQRNTSSGGPLRIARLVIWRVACATILLTVTAAGVAAHEIGTTRVSIVVHDDGTYEAEIVTDPASLLDKLQAVAAPRSATVRRDDVRAIPTYDETFRSRVHLTLDKVQAKPVIAYQIASATDAMTAASATIRLTGRLPAGTRTLTWAYGWTFASYALTVRGSSGPRSTQWLEGGQSTAVDIAAAMPRPSGVRTAARYLHLGFTHIVPRGLDHMLFVLGIYLLSGRARSVLCQISAFTVAHSITLALSMNGLLAVPPRIVEPLIAVSIAYVAIENIVVADLKAWRIALVFAFGLLHGMGFAGALQEVGLPRAEFLTALVAFNAGVEAGQLAVIGAAFVVVGWYCAHRAWYRTRIVIPASLLIACTAIYWTVERLRPV